MQKCSLCGGKVVNGRCEECGLPIPPENRYTLRSETVHTHEVNGEKVLHRVRQAPGKQPVYSCPPERRTGAEKTRRAKADVHPYRSTLGGGEQQKKPLARITWGIIALVLVFNVLPALITSCSA